jgi:hypothetical protein
LSLTDKDQTWEGASRKFIPNKERESIFWSPVDHRLSIRDQDAAPGFRLTIFLLLKKSIKNILWKLCKFW